MRDIVFCQNYETGEGSPSSEMEQAVMGVLRATRDLRQQLSATTMEQAGDLGQVTKAGQELVSTIRALALVSDIDRLQESSDRFHEYIEHILEVSSQTWPTHGAFVCTCILSSKSMNNEVFSRNIIDLQINFHTKNTQALFCTMWFLDIHIDLLLDIVRSDCHSSFLDYNQLQHLIGFIPRLTLSELIHVVHYSCLITINLRNFEAKLK